MDSTDRKRLATEVSVLHGIRIDPDDPMMAVVTLNRLVLESVLNQALSSVRAAVDEFNQAAERVQFRVGSAVGQEVRECVASIREELRKNPNEVRIHALEFVTEP